MGPRWHRTTASTADASPGEGEGMATLEHVDVPDSPTEPYAVAVIDDDPRLRTRLAMELGGELAVSSFPSIEAMEERFGPGQRLVGGFGPSSSRSGGIEELAGLRR